MLGQMGPGSALALRARLSGTRERVANAMLAPVVCLGVGSRPSLLFPSAPKPRGMARRKARCPDFAGRPVSTGGPDNAGPWARPARGCPRLPARHAVSGRLAFYGSPDEWGLPPVV